MMKIIDMKILKYIWVLPLLIFSSCTFEEENIFGETATVRMDNTLNKYEAALCEAEKGWIMEYFPTDTTEGYTFWMKFNTSTKVDMIAKNRWTKNLLTADSCVFDLLADNGPILSFPVAGNYETSAGIKVGIFHLFALPDDPDGVNISMRGYGLAGDYEFIVMNVEDTLIQLKGKKRGTDIRLHKLKSNENATDYFNALTSVETDLYKNNNQQELTLVVGNDTLNLKNNLLFYGQHARKFRMYEPGTDPLITGVDRSYIVIPNGIRFHSPFEFNGQTLQEFKFSSDKQKLTATNAKIEGPNIVDLFYSYDKVWKIDLTNTLGTGFATIYNQIVQNCQTVYKEKFSSLSLTYSSVRKSYVLNFVSGKYIGNFDFTKSMVNGKVVFSYSGTQDKNGGYYLRDIAGFSDLLTALSQPFTVSTDCGLNPTEIKLTGVNNSTISFYTVK